MIGLEDIKKSLIKLLHGRFSASGIRLFGEDLDQLLEQRKKCSPVCMCS